MHTNVRLSTPTDDTDMGGLGTCSLLFQHCQTEGFAMPFRHRQVDNVSQSSSVMRAFTLGVKHFECELLAICTSVLLLSVKALLSRMHWSRLLTCRCPDKDMSKTCHAAELWREIFEVNYQDET